MTVPAEIVYTKSSYGVFMSTDGKRQFCVICAWRENCAKKFSVTDGGAKCPDFSRDYTIKDIPATTGDEDTEGKGE